MELRDFFAAHVAAALAHRVERSEDIAGRAYDLAEALLRERARRGYDDASARYDGWLGGATETGEEAELAWLAGQRALGFERAGLLDEPAPMSERDDELDPSLFERDVDPTWERDPKWREGPRSDRPGLARGVPPAEEKRQRQA